LAAGPLFLCSIKGILLTFLLIPAGRPPSSLRPPCCLRRRHPEIVITLTSLSIPPPLTAAAAVMHCLPPLFSNGVSCTLVPFSSSKELIPFICSSLRRDQGPSPQERHCVTSSPVDEECLPVSGFFPVPQAYLCSLSRRVLPPVSVRYKPYESILTFFVVAQIPASFP